MDELKRASDIALQGPQAEQALSEFRRQLERWQVALPPATPFVLDFGLNDFARIGLVECWIANEARAGYCGKYLFVFDGQTCPAHRHRKKHETFFVVKGSVAMQYDGDVREMRAGEVLPVEPGKVHSFTGRGPCLLLELSMPCEVADNYFDDPAIPIGGTLLADRSAGTPVKVRFHGKTALSAFVGVHALACQAGHARRTRHAKA